MAQKLMKKLGFRKVYNIVGGTLLWAEDKLPFAPGLEPSSGFSWCPFANSIILWKKLKKLFQGKYQGQSTCCR